jgi:peptide/nickel transport system ATP-binding protein
MKTDGPPSSDDAVTATLRSGADVILTVRDLVVEFPAGPGKTVHAVSGVSFDVGRGETLGLVGESGSGKTTIGRSILRVIQPTRGEIVLDGIDLVPLSERTLRELRPRLQAIFQDPRSSLNPRRRVADIVAEPLVIWKRAGNRAERRNEVAEALGAVGLDLEAHGRRRPHEFSGGQCQRVAIARALVLRPEVLVCDEAVSSLDVSVQAQTINLLEELKARYDLTVIFISHDLSVIRHVSDRIAVLYLGKLCELGNAEAVYTHPAHPYTVALLQAVREPGDKTTRAPLGGTPPSAVNPPSGCRFHTRCPRADWRCTEEEPSMVKVGDDRYVACHHPHEPSEAMS